MPAKPPSRNCNHCFTSSHLPDCTAPMYNNSKVNNLHSFDPSLSSSSSTHATPTPNNNNKNNNQLSSQNNNNNSNGSTGSSGSGLLDSIRHMIHQYESFLVHNQLMLQGIKATANVAITFNMKEDSESFVELCNSILNIFDLYNDHLLTKHQRMNIEVQRDARFGPLYRINQLLKLIQYLSMIVEMYVTKHAQISHLKWPIILSIEICKCFLKLFSVFRIRQATKTPIHVHHSLMPTDAHLHLENAELLKLQLSDFSPAKQQVYGQSGEKAVGQRTGRNVPNLSQTMLAKKVMSDSVLLVPYHLDSNGNGNSGGSGSGSGSGSLLSSSSSSSSFSQTRVLIAEMLHAIRPVIYVLALIKFGTRSWQPWIISLVIDMSSQYFLTTIDERWKAQCVKQEINRRFSVQNYLFKSPMFDLLLKPVIEWVCGILNKIPLIGTLIANILEYTISVQHYYFYTELQ